MTQLCLPNLKCAWQPRCRLPRFNEVWVAAVSGGILSPGFAALQLARSTLFLAILSDLVALMSVSSAAGMVVKCLTWIFIRAAVT